MIRAQTRILPYQKLASRLLEYACTDAAERKSARALEITEGRNAFHRYSSCADLAHWLYYRLGVRDPWVNRDEHLGWAVGVNVSRLGTAGGFRNPPRGGLDAGDVTIEWSRSDGTDAHVRCIVACTGPEEYATAEYGQPGGLLKQIKISPDGLIGHKRIHRYLPLEAVLSAAWPLAPISLPEGFSP